MTSLLKLLEEQPRTYPELKELAERGELELERRSGESVPSALMGALERLGTSVERVARVGAIAVWAVAGARVEGRKPVEPAREGRHPWQSRPPLPQPAAPVEVITMATSKKNKPDVKDKDAAWMSSVDVAAKLGCTRRYAFVLGARGKLTTKKVGDGPRPSVLFSRASVDAYKAQPRAAAGPSKVKAAIAAKVARAPRAAAREKQEHGGPLERTRFIVRGAQLGVFTAEEALERIGVAVGEVRS